MSVVVVGAGITGLVLTYRLQQRGIPVLLLEANDRCGGVIQSVQANSFLLELGPNSSLSKQAFLELADELDLVDQLVAPLPEAKNRYLLRQEEVPQLVSLPKGPVALLRWKGLSTRAKLRVLCEPFLAQKNTLEDESVEEFVTRHFGKEVATQIVAPMLGGIWAADIAKLSCRSALPALWNLAQAHRSIVFGAAKRYLSKGSQHNKARPHIVSLSQGLEQLVNALVGAIDSDCIRYQCSIESLSRSRDAYSLQIRQHGRPVQLTTKLLALCLPANSTAAVLRSHDQSLAAQIAQIPYAPLGVLHLCAPRSAIQHPLNGFGLLIPPHLPYATLGTIFSSTLFAGRATAEHCLLTCFSGGASKPEYADVSRKTVQTKVLDELRLLLGISGPVDVLQCKFWPEAIPNYPVGHHFLQRAVDHFSAAHNGLYVLGNWYRGISVNDRIAQANEVAERIVATGYESENLYHQAVG